MENVLDDYTKHEINGVWFECQIAKPKFSENCDCGVLQEECQNIDPTYQTEEFESQGCTSEKTTKPDSASLKSSETSSKPAKSKKNKKKAPKKIQTPQCPPGLAQTRIFTSGNSSQLPTPTNPTSATHTNQFTQQHPPYPNPQAPTKIPNSQKHPFAYASLTQQLPNPSPQPRRYHSVSDHTSAYPTQYAQPQNFPQSQVDPTYYTHLLPLNPNQAHQNHPHCYQNAPIMYHPQNRYINMQKICQQMPQYGPQYGPQKYAPMTENQDFDNRYGGWSAQEPVRENQDFGFKSEVSKVLLQNLQRQKFYEISEEKAANISESLKLFCVEGGGEGSTRKGSTSGSEEDAVSGGGDFDYDAELKNLPFITNWLVEDDC
jgi:hypothetical protein